jgi:hypothetical protein
MSAWEREHGELPPEENLLGKVLIQSGGELTLFFRLEMDERRGKGNSAKIPKPLCPWGE